MYLDNATVSANNPFDGVHVHFFSFFFLFFPLLFFLFFFKYFLVHLVVLV